MDSQLRRGNFDGDSVREGAGVVRFRVKARHANGPYLSSNDGIRRAMALVRAIGTADAKHVITPVLIEGKTINEVSITCEVRLAAGFGSGDLEEQIASYCKRFDCVAEIKSFHGGYWSGVEDIGTVFQNEEESEI